MDTSILILFFAALLWRIYTRVVSRWNEQKLEASGACEYGILNSKILQVLHLGYYLAAFVEGYWRGVQFGESTLWGIGLYFLSVLVLLRVWKDLGGLWTVKLYIAPDQEMVGSWLFRHIRHPNYILSIVPELVGLGLMLEARYVLLIGFPVYVVSLAVRVLQEEGVMRKRFDDY